MKRSVVTTYKVARELAATRGARILINVFGMDTYLQVTKTDFLSTIRNLEATGQAGPKDYDGNDGQFWWYEETNHLYIDGSI